METLLNVGHGFGIALLPINLLYCFIGVFIGTLVGVLPGIGPISAMSLLLPITLSGTPESGIIMMSGIYYGSMYGGSTTSILVNIPGEAASVVTCIDGHQMAKQGRAGPARPWRAIWWPSMQVTTDEVSPGMFTRIEVVEPPYWAP